MHVRLGGLAWLVAVGLVLTACPNPVNAPRFGQVVLNFGGGSRTASRAASLPANVASLTLSIKAADMAEIVLSLVAPDLSATVDVPAGSGRVFVVREGFRRYRRIQGSIDYGHHGRRYACSFRYHGRYLYAKLQCQRGGRGRLGPRCRKL
ncbi:MAG: hypothetical protein WCT14_06770 [Treponemataceae bacterium]